VITSETILKSCYNHTKIKKRGVFLPTVLRIGAYKFYFYSHEPNEPPHVHIDRDNFSAKFWLSPVLLAKNIGFSPKELRKLEKLMIKHRDKLLEDWHGYFGFES
jgi:hypothetical protein